MGTFQSRGGCSATLPGRRALDEPASEASDLDDDLEGNGEAHWGSVPMELEAPTWSRAVATVVSDSPSGFVGRGREQSPRPSPLGGRFSCSDKSELADSFDIGMCRSFCWSYKCLRVY